MGASVTIFSPFAVAVMGMLLLLVVATIVLLIYGSVIAANGSAKIQGMGLLSGLILIVGGALLLLVGDSDWGSSKPIRQAGAIIICLGSFAFSASYFAYVRKHERSGPG